MSLQILLTILTGISIFAMGYYIVGRMQGGNVVQDRLKKIGHLEVEHHEDNNFLINENTESSLAKTLRAILIAVGVNFNKERERTEIKFLQAGISSPNALVYYLFMKKFGIYIALISAIIILNFVKIQGSLYLLVLLAVLIIVLSGTIGADYFLKKKRINRQYALQKSFPDGLDLILVCVESGLAIDGALARVCKELQRAYPALTAEFNKTRMELTLLNDREKALNNLAMRTGLMPFKSLVSALIQTEKFGTSLTETLRVLSDDYRHTRMMIAENKAARIPPLMTGVMMLTMIPAFMIIILAPAFLPFANDNPFGQ